MVGFLIFLSQVTFMYSVGNSNAGTTAVILTIVPLLCASWLSIAEKRPLRLKEGVCFLVASSGVLFIVTKGNFGTLDVSCVGVLWGLASALCSAAYSIQPRKLILNVGVGPVIGLGMLFASLVSSIINPPWTMDAEWHILSFLSFGFIVIFGTVAAFWCYLSSLKYVSAVVVGLLVCIEPLTAYLLSALAFGTRIGVWEGLGICLVLLNVLILSIPDRKQLRCQA